MTSVPCDGSSQPDAEMAGIATKWGRCPEMIIIIGKGELKDEKFVERTPL